MDIACLRERYLYLLRECLVDGIYKEDQVTLKGTSLPPNKVGEGFYFPKKAHTMLGRKKLDNIKHCMEYCLNNNIPGDFIETGVWRGGACIFMKGILKHIISKIEKFMLQIPLKDCPFQK